MADDDSLVSKLTFEDCLRNQQRLRRLLSTLIAENRCLSEGEVDLYFELLARSTFGMGVSKMFGVSVGSVGLVDLDNVEVVARWLGRQTSNLVVIHRDGRSNLPAVDICVFWERLLDLLFGVFPLSLHLAASMSKEREKSAGGLGFEFDWEK